MQLVTLGSTAMSVCRGLHRYCIAHTIRHGRKTTPQRCLPVLAATFSMGNRNEALQ